MTNVKALEVWTAQTICNIGILLSVVSALLHLGRPYFEALLIAFLLGFWVLNLDLRADIKIGLPFVPLGTVALALALAIKVFSNTEDVARSHMRMVGVVPLAATLNAIGYVVVMEAPGAEYAAAT